MKTLLRSASFLALVACALAADAAITPPTVTFSLPTAATALSTSGSVVVDFSGTVSGSTATALTGWSGTTLSLVGGTATVVPTSTYISAIQAAISATGTYSGKLLSYTFASGAAPGTYSTLTAPATLGTSNSTPRDSNATNLSIVVSPSPVPEPSAFAALGLGAVAVLRRRKK